MESNNFAHDRLQQECFLYAWNTYPETRRLLFHPNNETRPFKGESPAQYKQRLSMNFAIGVVKGVLDLIFFWHGTLYAFDIKLEATGDSLKKEQREFICQVERHAGRCFEIATLEQFKEIFDGLINHN